MEARDVMTRPVITVGPDTAVEEVARLMLERRVSALPVLDGAGRLRGIVSEGDLMRRRESGTERHRSWWLQVLGGEEAAALDYVKARGRTAEDVMTRKVVTAPERAPLERIATLLERHRIKRVPIVRAGRVVGIVSRANLLHGLIVRKARPRKASPAIDREIRSHILAEIDRAGVRHAHVNVVVSGGVAELWGGVDTPAQKLALRVAAKSTPGVKSVVDNVAVLPLAVQASLGAQ